MGSFLFLQKRWKLRYWTRSEMTIEKRKRTELMHIKGHTNKSNYVCTYSGSKTLEDVALQSVWGLLFLRDKGIHILMHPINTRVGHKAHRNLHEHLQIHGGNINIC